METWYDTLAPLLGVNPTARTLMTVQFAYRDPTRSYESEVYWGRGNFTLLAPSPHQSRLSAQGGLIPELHQQLASYLVEALIGVQADLRPTEGLPVEVHALYHELRDWAVARLSDSGAQREWRVPPTPLVDALVARKGVRIIPLLTVNLRQAETLDQVLAAAGLDPPDPMTHFAFLLAAANRAFDDLDESSYRALLDPEADRAWRQYYINQLRRRRESAQAGALWSAPSSLQIKSVVFNGEIAWVEAETTESDDVVHQAHFFRQVGDRWSLTSPDPVYFGERRTTRTENLVFEYFERDARWFEERMPAELQAVFSQAAADLGLATGGLIFTVTTELQPGVDGWLTEDSNGLRFTSPSVAGWPVHRLDDPLFQMAFPLLGGLFQKTIENVSEENLPHFSTLVAALLWELERQFPERVDWESLLDIDARQATILTLTDLWGEPTSEPYEDPTQIWAGYLILLEYLTETYGPEVVPALLDNVARTDDLDEWLRLSTGHGLEEIEPAWQAWVLTRYREQ